MYQLSFSLTCSASLRLASSDTSLRASKPDKWIDSANGILDPCCIKSPHPCLALTRPLLALAQPAATDGGQLGTVLSSEHRKDPSSQRGTTRARTSEQGMRSSKPKWKPAMRSAHTHHRHLLHAPPASSLHACLLLARVRPGPSIQMSPGRSSAARPLLPDTTNLLSH